MAIFILVILFICGGYEACQHYKAEKYANKVVHNKDTSFFDFMFSNHPIITITVIILIILIIASVIMSFTSVNKCPRCGQTWYGDGYCFGCQADIKGYK